MATDTFLLSRVGNAKSVAILGCAYCANQSIAYAKDISIIGTSSLGGLRFNAYATAQEANRIKELFEKNGKTAKTKIFTLPHLPYCQQSQKDRSAIAKECENCDAVVALSCNAGFDGIKSALPPETNVIPGMATLGTISSYLSIENGKVLLDKTKTKIIRFKQTSPAT
jgi:hypothetical protein